MRDIHSNVAVATLIGAAVLVADNTPAAVDLLGFNGLEVVLAIGIGGISFSGANKIEFVLTHSDDDVTYTPVETADMLGVTVADGGIIKALTAAHAAAASYRVGYKGGKRYVKLLADFGGTHGTGTPIAAVALLGHPELAPVANQA